MAPPVRWQVLPLPSERAAGALADGEDGGEDGGSASRRGGHQAGQNHCGNTWPRQGGGFVFKQQLFFEI